MFKKFNEVVEFCKNSGDVDGTYKNIHTEFANNVDNNEILTRHRDFVEINHFGRGSKSSYWMWNILVPELPQNFRFLEIGVYQGQTTSLISLLNRKYNKVGEIIGITPLDNTNDKYSNYPYLDYEERISLIYSIFDLNAQDLTLIKGLSTDQAIIKKVTDNYGDYGFDCVYIDGGHDYETVVSDIETFGSMARVGGYVILDDSTCKPAELIESGYTKLEDVYKAIEDKLENDDRFEHIFSIAHNRVWKRIK